MIAALSTEELARRSQNGCRASFTLLVERFGARLFRFLYRRTGNVEDADDLVQDTFVRAYQNIRRYKGSWRFSTWLFTIAARLAVSHHRSSHRVRTAGETESAAPVPHEAVCRDEREQGLWKLAATLPDSQYQALWLKYVEGMSVRDISRVLGKSQVSVKVLLYRARMSLAERLPDDVRERPGIGGGSVEHVVSFVKAGGAQCSAGSSD